MERKGENEYHVTVYDPGGNTGWAHFVVDTRAFSRPENKLLRWVKHWESGVHSGTEYEQIHKMVSQISNTTGVHGRGVSYLMYDVVSEGFELKQLKGGDNLLSPVRINAVLAWECANRAVKFHTQARNLRTSVTRERLKLWGYGKRYQKDEFAAMQHAFVWLRNLKAKSKSRPWKLSDGVVLNAYWDCDCSEGKRCDMVHP